MSKFNHFAVKADKIARKALEELTTAEKKLKEAESLTRQYPQQTGGRIVDAEYLARSARAHADLAEAQNRLKQTQANMTDYARQITAVRQELSESLTAEYAANPSDVDANVMTLLSSGILKSHEYSRLMSGANPTMQRIIAAHAKDAAEKLEKEFEPNHPEYHRVMELKAIANEGSADPTGDKLQAFDVLLDCFQRSVNNTAMIGSWDSLVTPILDVF